MFVHAKGGDQMTDGREKRVANDTQMVFMARTIERLYGEDALDALVQFTRERTLKRCAKKREESGPWSPGDYLSLFSDHAHEFEVIRNEPDCLEVKVTRCVHADVCKSYNAADVGEKLICSGDHAVVAGYSPDMELVRPSTCMTGDCCHFVFKRKESSG